MIPKFCLIIDDEDQSVQINKLKESLRWDGYELNCHQINPNDYVIEDPNKEEALIDKKQLLRHIKHEIQKGVVLIACDNNISDSLKGYELLFYIRNELKFKYDFILYSGILDSLITELYESEDSFNKIRHLVEARISKFLRRNNTYMDDIKGAICNQSFDPRQEILHWLRSFKHASMRNHAVFGNRTFEELAKEIEEDTNLGIKFQKDMIENSISLLIDLKSFSEDE